MLPLGVARVGFSERGGDLQALLVGVEGARQVALRLANLADLIVADRELSLPMSVTRVRFGEAGADL